MASVKLLDSHSKAGSTRWDGKPIKPTPKLHQLPEAVVKDLRKITQVRRIPVSGSMDLSVVAAAGLCIVQLR
jgi:hypothetical protein